MGLEKGNGFLNPNSKRIWETLEKIMSDLCFIKDQPFVKDRIKNMVSTLQTRQWQPTPVLLPGKSHGWRSLVGCSPWGREESDTTEWLHFHFSLSCIGAGNGNPLRYSCLENPRDGGAWWAAICGVAQDWSDLAAAAPQWIIVRKAKFKLRQWGQVKVQI